MHHARGISNTGQARSHETGSYAFFRGTFYRWAQLWPRVCADVSSAPKIISVGDLHIDSFGTWRDSEGRLAWGVDDFDESYPLSYTNDLVRLAASVKIAIGSEKLTIAFKQACIVIVEGYREPSRTKGVRLCWPSGNGTWKGSVSKRSCLRMTSGKS